MSQDYKYIKLEEYKYYKNGTKFTITKEPKTWASTVGGTCPIRGRLSFPYKGGVEKIGESKRTGVIAMYDGEYGWSLDKMIIEGIISIDIKQIRKEKIKKLRGL